MSQQLPHNPYGQMPPVSSPHVLDLELLLQLAIDGLNQPTHPHQSLMERGRGQLRLLLVAAYRRQHQVAVLQQRLRQGLGAVPVSPTSQP